MKIINEIYQSKIEIKKSVFLSFLCPFKDFKILLEKLKKEHPKAVHFVYAYRYLNEFNQILEDKSDDGEPKGTSGMPSLNVLRGYELVDIGVIVVRYFGGIKLGTGGLVRAYSDSVNAVINEANILEFEFKKKINFIIPFALYARFEHYFNKNNIKFDKNFKENVELGVELNEKEENDFLYFIKDFNLKEIEFKTS